MNSNSHGFSIFELIIVLALTSLLLAGGSLSLRELLNRMHLRQATLELDNLLQTTAQVAQAAQCDMEVIFNNADDSAKVLPCDNLITSRQQTYKLPQGISFTDVSFGRLSDNRAAVLFRSSGSASPGHLTLRSKNGAVCRITQALRGLRTVSCD